MYPASKRFDKTKIQFFDWFLAGGGIIVTGYILMFYEELVRRGGRPTSLDMVMGVIAIILVLEVTRRSIGPQLPIIATIFLIYTIVGPIFPEFWGIGVILFNDW